MHLRFRLFAATVCAASLLVGAAASAQVASLPLPPPPAQGNQAASAIFDAMMAIARSAVSNPPGAQRATFTYNQAVQQYNAGNQNAALASANLAISQAAVPPLAIPTLAPPVIPPPLGIRLADAGSVPGSESEEYLALAWRALSTCGAPGATQYAPALAHYKSAVAANVAHKYGPAKTEAIAAVNLCATALAQQQAALEAAQASASPTPMPMTTYVPQQVVTPGPDPALQQGPQAYATPTLAPGYRNVRY